MSDQGDIESTLNELLNLVEEMNTSLAELEDRVRFLEATIGEDTTDTTDNNVDGSPFDLEMVSDQ